MPQIYVPCQKDLVFLNCKIDEQIAMFNNLLFVGYKTDGNLSIDFKGAFIIELERQYGPRHDTLYRPFIGARELYPRIGIKADEGFEP